MKLEDKQLLLADICARIPYGVKAQVLGWDEEKGEVEVPLKIYSINTDGYVYFETNDYDVNYLPVEDCRLYLRPMSSMTEEEVKKFYDVECIDAKVGYIKPTLNWHFTINGIDWLLKYHFDFRGIIPKDLALSTEIYNPYKN